MSINQTPDFAQYVWNAVPSVGRSAPRIVDRILRSVFPETTEAAEREGAHRVLRKGCIAEVKRVLHATGPVEHQADFANIAPSFLPLVKNLQRPSYFVPEVDEEIPLTQLIAEPTLLNSARCYMRAKGMECLAEADRLDQLFFAITQTTEEAA